MIVLNYSDYTNMRDISALCKANKVVFDFKLYDIPATMRRNIKTLAKLGGHAVTIADDPLNCMGIDEAKQAGKDYGIKIIVGRENESESMRKNDFWASVQRIHPNIILKRLI